MTAAARLGGPRLGALCLLALVAGCDSGGLAAVPGPLVLTATAEGFLIETEETYPCANYPLVVDADVGSEGASIEVEGVGEVQVCATALGPARVLVPFPDGMEPVGYGVALHKGGRTDRFEYACGFAGCGLAAVGAPEFTRIGPR